MQTSPVSWGRSRAMPFMTQRWLMCLPGAPGRHRGERPGRGGKVDNAKKRTTVYVFLAKYVLRLWTTQYPYPH